MRCLATMKRFVPVLVLCVGLAVVASGDDAATATNKTKIKVATLLQPPLMMRDAKTGAISGYFVEVLDRLGYSLSHVNSVINNTYGMEEFPGKFSLALKDVTDGNSDVAIVALDSENQKTPGVTFTHPVFNLGFIGLYKTPKEWNPSFTTMMTLIEPFSPGLWCLIIFMCLMASGALFLLRWFSPFEPRTANEVPPTTRPNSFMYIFASLWGQSSAEAPLSFSARLLACVWWVFSLMTAAAYMAGLLAILLRMNPHVATLPFGSIDEMIRQTEVEVLAIKDSATHKFFSRNQGHYSSMLWDMWSHHLDDVVVDSMDGALKKMMAGDGKYALFILEPTALYMANSIPCDKMVVAEPVGDLFYGFACKKGSKICEDLDQRIVHLREAGTLEKMMSRWIEKGCHEGTEYLYQGKTFIDTFGVGDPNWLSPMTLTIKRFSGAFVMLVIGIVAAFLVLIAEIVYSRLTGKVLNVPSRGHDDMQGIAGRHPYATNQDM